MRFEIITIFPEIFDSYLNTSILKRANEQHLISVKAHDLRNYTTNKHRKVDDTPYGGGAGMVLMAEPIISAYADILKQTLTPKARTKTILFSAKGKEFNQKLAYQWEKNYDRLIFITGRYEGIDERVRQALKADEISIGPYVLTDGDVAAMVVTSAVARLIPGVIRFASLEEESHWNLITKKEKNIATKKGFEYPHYTRPEILEFKGKNYRVPKILLSGNHKQIRGWRNRHAR